jgi:Sugar phosphate permease
MTLGILFVVWFIGYFDRMAINIAIIPVGKEYGLSASEEGLILSSFFIGYSIIQLFGGWFADKFGSKAVLISCVFAWSVFTGLTGFAFGFLALFVVRFLFGLGEGSFSPASSVAVAENFPLASRAKAKSVLLSSYQLAGIVGAFGVASLMVLYNWRVPFHILAVLGLILMSLLAVFLPSTRGRGEKRERRKIPVRDLLHDDLIWKVVIIWFGNSVVNWGLATWMPSYLVNVRHLNLISMGLLSSIPPAAGFVATLATGWMLDRLSGYEKYFMVIGSTLTALFLYMMFTAPTIALAIVFWSFCQASFCAVFVTVFAVPLKNFPKHLIGTATGFVNFGGQIAGIIAPSLIGLMISLFHGSYNAAFWSLVICVAISVAAGTTLTLRKRTV